MAHHKSSKKRIKISEKKNLRNKMLKSRVRTYIKKLRSLVTENKKEEALKLFPEVQSLMAKAAKTPAMPKAQASRLTSNLAHNISKLA